MHVVRDEMLRSIRCTGDVMLSMLQWEGRGGSSASCCPGGRLPVLACMLLHTCVNVDIISVLVGWVDVEGPSLGWKMSAAPQRAGRHPSERHSDIQTMKMRWNGC